jgi:hypothetical protein
LIVGRIPEETIEAIRNRTDIVDLVGRYVSLRQMGRSFKGLCPFHQEKTPSFHVHPERQIFHFRETTVGEVKRRLRELGIAVRIPSRGA